MPSAPIRLLVVCFVLSCLSTNARAHDTYIVNQGPGRDHAGYGAQQSYRYDAHRYPGRPRPSIFKFGYRGMIAGGLAGLGAGYFMGRGGSGGEGVAIGAGMGALAGAGLGLSLGIIDRLGVQTAYYISRDLFYGVCFGALVGAISGGIIALGEGDAESVLAYTAAGSLAGVGLGVLVGVIEGVAREDPPYDQYVQRRKLDVAVARLGARQDGWGATLRGSF
ncbi:MAG: hypothetical protein JWN04_3653 [Myxococcaceae bacterium]|nr:hypothetical protein [Myxococcaceae bacterium]